MTSPSLPGLNPFDETNFPATREQVSMEVRGLVRRWLDAWFEEDWEALRALTDIYDDYPDPAAVLAGATMDESEWQIRLGVHQRLSLKKFRLTKPGDMGASNVTFPYLGALNIATVKVHIGLALDNFFRDMYGLEEIEVTLYLRCQSRQIDHEGKLDTLLSEKPWLSEGWRVSLNSIHRVLAEALSRAEQAREDQGRQDELAFWIGGSNDHHSGRKNPG